MKRISAFICILLVLLSCTESPEERLLALKENWVKADTNFISEERLNLRFEKAIEYIQTHRPYWGFPLEGCNELQTDTLRQEITTFKIASAPLKQSNLDRDISFTLDQVWACEIYNQPFYSLRTQISTNSSQPSEQARLVIKHSSETMNEVTSWRKVNLKNLNEITSSILANLPSDEESEQVALFEVPTGKTLRVHLPASYHNLNTDWDSLKNVPNQILLDTYAADVAVIFYDDNDEIEKVWWISWQS